VIHSNDPRDAVTQRKGWLWHAVGFLGVLCLWVIVLAAMAGEWVWDHTRGRTR
jgi:hypothetical protein